MKSIDRTHLAAVMEREQQRFGKDRPKSEATSPAASAERLPEMRFHWPQCERLLTKVLTREAFERWNSAYSISQYGVDVAYDRQG
jgi:hypothetical protein